ncbi:MAG: hypothetical protein KF812_04330 [Fimbriimonadaceae bacterium]|nr:hypothetical protein [Fimbriimonadaceae bacterium]
MLWREGYKPEVSRGWQPAGPALTPVWPCPTILVPDEDDWQTAEVWWRLLEAGAPGQAVLVGVGWEWSELRQVVAPSRRARTYVCTSNEAEAFAGSQVTRTISVCPGLKVLGPPTEEVWEEFLNRLRADGFAAQ